MQPQAVKEHVIKLCNGALDDRGLSRFLRLCVRFSIAYLKMQSSKGYRILEGPGGGEAEWESVAVQALATLFRREEQGRFPQLAAYFKPLLETDPSPIDCLMALRRLIVNKTQQGLADLFAERDPEGARIRRNVQIAVQKNPQTVFRTTLRGEEIVLGAQQVNPPDTSLRLLDSILDATLYPLARARDTVPQVLEKLLTGLAEEQGLPACCTLSALTAVIKGLHQGRGVSGMRHASWPEEAWVGALDAQAIQHAVAEALDAIKGKVDSDYIRRGKLSVHDGKALKTALDALASDWAEGLEAEPFFVYLKQAMPGLAEPDYRSQYRTCFEYLVKLFRGQIDEALKDFSAIKARAGSTP